MQATDDNLAYCLNLAQGFESMKTPPAESRFDRVMLALAKTLMGACTSRQIAKEIAEAVIDNEEFFPAPATLRKYLRERDYLEEDVALEQERRSEELRAKQREQLRRERGDVAPLELVGVSRDERDVPHPANRRW